MNREQLFRIRETLADMTASIGKIQPIVPVLRPTENLDTPPTAIKIVPITPVVADAGQTLSHAIKHGVASPKAQQAWDVMQGILSQSYSPVVFPSPEYNLNRVDSRVATWLGEIVAEMNEPDVNRVAVIMAANSATTLEHLSSFGSVSNARSKEHMAKMMAMLQDPNLQTLRGSYVKLAELISEYRERISQGSKPPVPPPSLRVGEFSQRSTSGAGWFKRLFGGGDVEPQPDPTPQFEPQTFNPRTIDMIVAEIKTNCDLLLETNPKVGSVMQELWDMMTIGQKTSRHLVVDIIAMRLRERQAIEVMKSQSNPMESQKWRVTAEQCGRRIKHLLLAENLTKSDWVALTTSLQEIQTLSAQVDDLVIVVNSQVLQERNLSTIQASREQVSKAMNSLANDLNRPPQPSSPPAARRVELKSSQPSRVDHIEYEDPDYYHNLFEQ